MTLYQVDRVAQDVGKDDNALRAFLMDSEAYLAGRDLEEHERAALANADCAALWSMGAHPFILHAFIRRVWIARGRAPDRVMDEYKAAIAPLGRPSYAT
jgi:hypothetical protein